MSARVILSNEVTEYKGSQVLIENKPMGVDSVFRFFDKDAGRLVDAEAVVQPTYEVYMKTTADYWVLIGWLKKTARLIRDYSKVSTEELKRERGIYQKMIDCATDQRNAISEEIRRRTYPQVLKELEAEHAKGGGP